MIDENGLKAVLAVAQKGQKIIYYGDRIEIIPIDSQTQVSNIQKMAVEKQPPSLDTSRDKRTVPPENPTRGWNYDDWLEILTIVETNGASGNAPTLKTKKTPAAIATQCSNLKAFLRGETNRIPESARIIIEKHRKDSLFSANQPLCPVAVSTANPMNDILPKRVSWQRLQKEKVMYCLAGLLESKAIMSGQEFSSASAQKAFSLWPSLSASLGAVKMEAKRLYHEYLRQTKQRNGGLDASKDEKEIVADYLSNPIAFKNRLEGTK